MWKESYRIGIDLIDRQHEELFRATDTLVRAIEANADKQTFPADYHFFKGLYSPAFPRRGGLSGVHPLQRHGGS